MDKTTTDLHNELVKSSDMESFLKTNAQELVHPSLPLQLAYFLTQKNISKAKVIQHADLPKGYAYNIFKGAKKSPSRDTVLRLAFGLGLSSEETKYLLLSAGYNELYPRNPRDSVILFSLNKHQSLLKCNQLLADLNLPIFENKTEK